MNQLCLPALPPLPQLERLRQLAPVLWESPGVVALWLGGSFGSGQADLYSDLDLRLAVRPKALDAWRKPDLQALIKAKCAGSHFIAFADDRFLHHVALTTGEIIDLSVQSAERDPFAEAILVLGCRDPEFARRLQQVAPPGAALAEPVDPAAIRQAIIDFWINNLKHRKVLHRGLDLLALTGLEIERATLMRLWFITATGTDTGPGRESIHGKTPVIHAVERLLGAEALALLGAPTRNRSEILQVIEAHRDEVSHVGRLLAERHQFAYPVPLEETVRRTWQVFLAIEELSGVRET
jgi:hypothetical protein